MQNRKFCAEAASRKLLLCQSNFSLSLYSGVRALMSKPTNSSLSDIWFQPKHLNVAAGNLLQRLPFALSITCRRIPNAFMKERTERAETFEPDFETHISDGQAASAQQLFGFFYASLD